MSDQQGLFYASGVAASGLRANRLWMNIVSNNLANAHTLDTGKMDANGNYAPYARQVPVFAKILDGKQGAVRNGVEVKEVASLNGEVRKVYDPGHPAARQPGTSDAGYVYYPDISSAQEIADLRAAAASYEANLTVLAASKKMMSKALQINRRM